jgi:glycosyltransferase involved in cell wall biosynthesis
LKEIHMLENIPKISVITISFNQKAYLEECMLSVLDQNYSNLEYIIIDAGSTDGSAEIIKKYEHRLAWWISEPDNGMYDGIQKGFAKSTGEIMTWINSDDKLSANSLKTVAEIFTNFRAIEWLSGIPNIIDEHGKTTWVGNFPKWNKYRYLQQDFRYIQQEGTFWRRSLWNKSGGKISNQYTLAGDLELWSRFFQNAELYHVTVFLGTFRRRQKDQKTLELKNYDEEAIEILKQMARTKEDEKILSLQNIKLPVLSSNRKKETIQKAQSAIKKFTLPLLFDEKIQQFILYDVPYS